MLSSLSTHLTCAHTNVCLSRTVFNANDRFQGNKEREKMHIRCFKAKHSYFFLFWMINASTCQSSYRNWTHEQIHFGKSCSTIRAHLTPKDLVIRPSFVWFMLLKLPSVLYAQLQSVTSGKCRTFEKLPDAISVVVSGGLICSGQRIHWNMSRTT